MSDALEKLQRGLEAAQHALAKAEARLARQEAEHQASVQKIERAHQEWETVLDAVDDPIFVHDRDFRILRCNKAYQQRAGMPFEQIIGQPYFEVFPLTHVPLPNCRRTVEQSVEAEDDEMQVGDRAYRSRAYSVTDKQGAYLYSVHALEDITERQHTEEYLLLFRTLLDNSSDAIEVLDPATSGFLDVNETECRELGYSREELLSMTIENVDPTFTPELKKAIVGQVRQSGSMQLESVHRRKDGSTFPVEVSTKLVELDRPYVLNIVRNITERKQVESLLHDSTERLRAIFDGALDGIGLVEVESQRLSAGNLAMCRMLGYSPEEFAQLSVKDLHPQQDLPYVFEQFGKQARGEIELARDMPMKRKDGSVFYADINTSAVSFGGKNYMVGMFRDITERKRTEAELRASELAYRTMAENLPGIAYRVFVREGGRMDFYNKMVAQVTGYTEDELDKGKVCSIEPLILDEDRPGVVVEVMRAVAEHRAFMVDYRLRHKNGDIRWLAEHGKPVFGEDGMPLYIDGVIFDVTERRQASENQRLFRTLLDNSSDGIEVIDLATLKFLDVNETECLSLGYSREELLSMRVMDLDPEFDEDAAAAMRRRIQQTGAARFESRHRRKDGSMFPVEISAKQVELDRHYLLSIVRDISDRKLYEETLARANRALRTLSASNMAVVQATSESGLLQAVTNIIVHEGGYRLAAVCYAEHDAQKRIVPMAWASTEAGYYLVQDVSWADTAQGQVPVARAIRGGTTQICRDIAGEPGYAGWKEAVQASGYVSNLALPLSIDGKTFGGLSIYSSRADAFDGEEVQFLEELANDLAYGVVNLRTRIEHEQHATILQESLEQSIQAIAGTVEARDPYTAGHQRRVSEVATAIAREMGLPEDRVNGIHLAAIIHDLGKIHIPAEILAKPGKLSDIELRLVRTHPQDGYEILKDVKFPWPIADIVLQHHERMDGSGYPQGLKGDQILLESRIIAVADVVDAMSTHRPYRSSLGAEVALDEIRSGRGSKYDAAVVDACLKLFTEQGFTFGGQKIACDLPRQA
ncbi:MAG: PAS domain S-box protein [Sideroxydans sp.]|nr:PAS domain S-box protein [Sideroxydans sp.]